MLMHGLAFVVIFGMELAVRAGYRLRRLVSFESHIGCLVVLGKFLLAEAVVTKHQVVMRLQVFGIDGQNRLQSLHCVAIPPLKKEDSSQIVERDAVAWILRHNDSQALSSAIIVAVG